MSKTKSKVADKGQSKRFIETARQLNADESGLKFEYVFNTVVPAKRVLQNGSIDSGDDDAVESASDIASDHSSEDEEKD